MTVLLIIVAGICLLASLASQRLKDALWGAFWGALLLAFVIGTATRWWLGDGLQQIIAGPFDY